MSVDLIISEGSNFLKTWMPWTTAAILIWRSYAKLRDNISTWAGTLLDNHLAHLQVSLSNIEKLLQQLVEK